MSLARSRLARLSKLSRCASPDRPAETITRMVVDHAGGLHEGVTDCGADESEAATPQVFAHGVRFWREYRDALRFAPIDFLWEAADELPDVVVEAPELLLDGEKCF